MATSDDLQARIRTAIADGEQKISFILGSGLSNGIVPSVPEMVKYFVDELPRAEQQSVARQLGQYGNPTQKYQEAVNLLIARGGVRRLRTAICKATLQACVTDSVDVEALSLVSNKELRELEFETDWKLGSAHIKFAELYARLPPRLRGSILTTNFDPLIEVALFGAGVQVEAIPLSGTTAPTIDQLDEKTAVPVFHLHGYWRAHNTLHTPAQLTRTRPAVQKIVRQALSEAIVIVVGYGGWDDVITSVLQDELTHGELFNSELCWGVYSTDETSIMGNATLQRVSGSPGCSLYFGVEASRIFDIEFPEDSIEARVSDTGTGDSPDGYTAVSLADLADVSPKLSRFADGDEPTWSDALPGAWPLLDASYELLTSVEECLLNRGGVVAAIGPIGEGKSLALRQIILSASQLHVAREWTFLWREHGAPPITREWIADARTRFGRVCVFVDSADVIIDEVIPAAVISVQANSDVCFVLACHDRVWWSRSRGKLDSARTVLFHGITEQDADQIADRWAKLDILPTVYSALPRDSAVSATSAQLLRSSIGVEGSTDSTLLGAVLATRNARGLERRVEDLIDRLSRESASSSEPITMAHVFGAICLVQITLDPDGIKLQGLNREVLCALVSESSQVPEDRLLGILGREAAISFAGDHVYSRHRSIAYQAVRTLRSRNEIDFVCEKLGRAGARVQQRNPRDRRTWADAYFLTKSLDREGEALAAANGLLKGAPDSYKARLDRVYVLRKWKSSAALTTAEKCIIKRHQFSDFEESIRIFLNELARCAIMDAQPELALGSAALGLGGKFRYHLDDDQVSYFFKTFIDASFLLRAQNAERSGNIPELSARLTNELCDSEQRARVFGNTHVAPVSSAIALGQVLTTLQQSLLPFAQRVVERLEASEHLSGSLDFTWLQNCQ